MELQGPWEAALADDEHRRSWLDDPDSPSPADPTSVNPAGTSTQDNATNSATGIAHTADTETVGGTGWEAVAVPGHWRSSAAFADSNGPLLYRTDFEHPGPVGDERWWLRFDGAFYQGDVWLDGGYVGDTEGYFFPHTFEVTDALRDRTGHRLGVELTSRLESDPATKRAITGVFGDPDTMDRAFNPGGLWRPVRLERTGPIRIRHLRVLCRDANPTRATVAFRAVLDAATAGEVTLRSTVGAVDHVDQRRLAAGENQVEWQVSVDNPDLWWPHALGDQPLYDVTVEVTAHPDPDSDQLPPDTPVSHRVTRHIGLRQINLRNWVMHVNGERLFLKGANLGPTRTALAEASADELRRDVTLARDANLDLIRLRAHVTRPELYRAADEAGMLIWQDFPLHRAYGRSIRKQAQRQARELVDLLGHHPSIAVWCGHNEPFALDVDAGTTGATSTSAGRYLARQELPSWNKSILDRTVKRTIEKADPSRQVIAHSGVLPHLPTLDGTSSHLWFGWRHGHERDLAGFARLFPRMMRFVSEFGAQSVPDSDDFCEPDRWPDLDWESLAAHHGLQRQTLEQRVPVADHPDFASWKRATQTYQADLIRHHIETLRRLKYRPTGGFTMSDLADSQPAISWAVLDHQRRPKAAHRALVQACRPVIVTADRLPAQVAPGDLLAIDVHVISDLRTPLVDLEVNARLRWDGGQHHWRYGGEVAADDCIRVATLSVEVPDAVGPLVLELSLTGPSPALHPVVTRTDATTIAAPTA